MDGVIVGDGYKAFERALERARYFLAHGIEERILIVMATFVKDLLQPCSGIFSATAVR